MACGNHDYESRIAELEQERDEFKQRYHEAKQIIENLVSTHVSLQRKEMKRQTKLVQAIGIEQAMLACTVDGVVSISCLFEYIDKLRGN
jgi:ribulose 1,5-bisphosphate carboxylase large subunit-like protein